VGVGGAGGGTQPLGVAEPFVLDAQVGVLSGPRVDRLDLVEAELEDLDLAGPVARLGAQVLQLAAQLDEGVEELLVVRERRGERRSAELVEQCAVLVCLAEPPLVGLPMHRDEVLPDLAQHPHGGRPAADVRAGASFGRDRADQHQPVDEVGAGFFRAHRGGMAP
jgi:hypothetical protein